MRGSSWWGLMALEGGEPSCFAPVLIIEGRVLDFADGSCVDGAHVVALDIDGSARSSVASPRGSRWRARTHSSATEDVRAAFLAVNPEVEESE